LRTAILRLPLPLPLPNLFVTALSNVNQFTKFFHWHITEKTAHVACIKRSSAIAEGPRDASCQLKSCQLPRNSAETTCTTSPEQIMKLEGYTGPMCNKHVHSTMTRSSRFHCLIGVINKPITGGVVDITCIPTTCCGEIV